MSIEELLDKIKKLSWISIKEYRKSGFLEGSVLKENGRKKTKFLLIFDRTFMKLSFSNSQKGNDLLYFVEKSMDIAYLEVTFQIFFWKRSFYMWEQNEKKFQILYNDYLRMIEKGNILGYKKNIYLKTPA